MSDLITNLTNANTALLGANISKARRNKAANEEKEMVDGAEVLVAAGHQALTALSPEMRSVLETQAAHVVAQKMNDKQAMAETGVTTKDAPEAAKTMVAMFAGTVIATAGRTLSPEELAARIANHIGGEISEQEPGTVTMAAPAVHNANLSRLPENLDHKRPELSKRSLYAIVAGAIGAAIGWISGEVYTRVKLYDFDGAVDNMVRNDITNRRTGIGAAMDSAGGAIEHAPLGNFGPGASSHSLRLAHEYNLAQTGKYPFARFVKRIGALPVTLGSAAVAGTAVAAVTYMAMKPEKDQAEKDWASKVEADKDQTRIPG